LERRKPGNRKALTEAPKRETREVGFVLYSLCRKIGNSGEDEKRRKGENRRNRQMINRKAEFGKLGENREIERITQKLERAKHTGRVCVLYMWCQKGWYLYVDKTIDCHLKGEGNNINSHILPDFKMTEAFDDETEISLDEILALMKSTEEEEEQIETDCTIKEKPSNEEDHGATTVKDHATVKD
jgi:hypothetical protein